MNASSQLAAKFQCKTNTTQDSQYLFLFYLCHLFLSSLYLSSCSCRLCHIHFKRLWDVGVILQCRSEKT